MNANANHLSLRHATEPYFWVELRTRHLRRRDRRFSPCRTNRPELRYNDLGEGGGRALAEALRLNTTLASLNLSYNRLGEGGGLALAEALRLNQYNITVTSVNLYSNRLGEG